MGTGLGKPLRLPFQMSQGFPEQRLGHFLVPALAYARVFRINNVAFRMALSK